MNLLRTRRSRKVAFYVITVLSLTAPYWLYKACGYVSGGYTAKSLGLQVVLTLLWCWGFKRQLPAMLAWQQRGEEGLGLSDMAGTSWNGLFTGSFVTPPEPPPPIEQGSTDHDLFTQMARPSNRWWNVSNDNVSTSELLARLARHRLIPVPGDVWCVSGGPESGMVHQVVDTVTSEDEQIVMVVYKRLDDGTEMPEIRTGLWNFVRTHIRWHERLITGVWWRSKVTATVRVYVETINWDIGYVIATSPTAGIQPLPVSHFIRNFEPDELLPADAAELLHLGQEWVLRTTDRNRYFISQIQRDEVSGEPALIGVRGMPSGTTTHYHTLRQFYTRFMLADDTVSTPTGLVRRSTQLPRPGQTWRSLARGIEVVVVSIDTHNNETSTVHYRNVVSDGLEHNCFMDDFLSRFHRPRTAVENGTYV